jgi:hypothetical protein
MVQKLVVFVALVLPALAPEAAPAAEKSPPASRWIPQDAVIVFEVSRPEALLDVAFDPRVGAAVATSPAYQKLASQPRFREFLGVIRYLETRLDTDWKGGLRRLIAGGVTLAARPDGTVWLMIDAEDPKLLNELHEILLGFTRAEAEKQGQPGRVASVEYRGVTGWTFGGGEAHAIIGNRLLLSNKAEALRGVLDLRADPQGQSLASLPAYQAARRAVGPEAAATIFVRLDVLKQHPPFQKALTQSGNPMASLLFAGVTEAIRGSSWLAMGLGVEGETLKLEAVVDGTSAGSSGPAAFALPDQPDQGAWPNLSVPRRIAALSLYRDLHAFYAAKDELFPERGSGLIFFENMMGIFFTGRDLTEEVLAETTPEIRLVVAQQEYDPSVGTPRVQIPAFAAIFRMRNPEQFAEVVEEAWQKALGLINFTQGQQAQPGLIIDRLFQGETKFSIAYYSSRRIKAGTEPDTRYNFRPALAMPGDYVILSSTEALARDLIDAVENEAGNRPKPTAETHSLVELDAVQLASILGVNRENLIRQNMVNEGNTREQAETQIDVLLTILGYLGRAKLDVGTRDGRPRASLELKLNLPQE